MPALPDGSALDYVGVLSVVAGFFLILAGLGIIELDKIKVKPGRITCGFGICLVVLGFVLLWLGREKSEDGSVPPLATVVIPSPTVTFVDLGSTPCGKDGKKVPGWCWDNDQGSDAVSDTLVDLYSSDGKSIWVSVRDRNAKVTVNGEPLENFSDENNGVWDVGYFREAPWDVTVSADDNKEQYNVTFTVVFKRVALKTAHDRYVTATNADYDWVLRAETKDIRDWEKFTLLCQDNGKVALQTWHKNEDGNNRFVTARGEDFDWVLEGETVVFNDYEEFTLLDADTGMWRPCSGVVESLEKDGEARVALQTYHNRFVTAMDGNWDVPWVLRAETSVIGESEKFRMILLPDDS